MLHSASRRLSGGTAAVMTAARSSGRVRVTGVLHLAQRGPVLMTDDEAWLLETEEDLTHLAGRTVIAEGERHGLDHLRADYVAPAPREPS
ncbi:DUF5818 domain-containing protein [Novosphingobium sp. 9U]|uniref:DUF5818 domain-containing protein n=1 Tax=Novosphingobium sp. 9U TaxID=2653158 RepID=UPI0012F0A02B|nr:DUF5818 domain-containing protein [Novosphingobium sp. 9U]VWX51108.1 hypothetical protein NOVOSPHI9U_370096 [Novosphingobium sp. 9U]